MFVTVLIVAGVVFAVASGLESRRRGGLIAHRPYNNVYSDATRARSTAPLEP